jgi:hypothetical protein
MHFNNFWKWLCLQGRVIRNLGDRTEFAVCARGLDGTAIPLATKDTHSFTIRDAKLVWDRYHTLSADEQQMAGHYVSPNWSDCPNQTCCPWIAAAIRDFEIGQSKL